MTLPKSAIRHITEQHAQNIHEAQKSEEIPAIAGCAQQIAEIDGCMLPVMQPREDEGDQRKQKVLCWKEARLALVHEEGCLTPTFAATFQESVDESGKSLLNAAVGAGMGQSTKVHGVGDGAPWIENQMTKQFAKQGSYLIDFYHNCEYLAAASSACSEDNKHWMETQKNHLKNNENLHVIENLKPYLEPSEVESNQAPVRACYRYLNNRLGQLDYKGAIEKGLPIGSGEIESAHRYVIQERLKIAGAWWTIGNVRSMLALRVIRANNAWDDYWENMPEAA